MGIFSKNKEPKGPEAIIKASLSAVSNRLLDTLNGEEYLWQKAHGVKRFECLILSKYLLDYSFKSLAEDKLKEDETEGFTQISNSVFEKSFNDEFSEVGIHFEDMKDKVEGKIEEYFESRLGNKPPACWHIIYSKCTNSKSIEELEKEMEKQSNGLEVIRGNENFANLVPKYEARLESLKNKCEAFESAEMMLPHMVRFTKEKLKAINLKKIKALSKKLAKKDKGKKDKKDKKGKKK